MSKEEELEKTAEELAGILFDHEELEAQRRIGAKLILIDLKEVDKKARDESRERIEDVLTDLQKTEVEVYSFSDQLKQAYEMPQDTLAQAKDRANMLEYLRQRFAMSIMQSRAQIQNQRTTQ